MIDADAERLLEVPIGAALFQPPDWPFAACDVPALSPVGRLAGAPSVGTVWTVGMAGTGVVKRDTVTAPGAVDGEGAPVGMAPRVCVMRWTDGVGVPAGVPVAEEPTASGSDVAPEVPEVAPPSPKAGLSLLKTPDASVSDVFDAESAAVLVARGRSPMSWAVTTGASKLSTTGELSTGDGSDHSPPTPDAPLLSEVGGGWAAPGTGTGSANETVEGADALPCGVLTTGSAGVPEDVGDGVLGVAGVVVLRWTMGAAKDVASVGVLEAALGADEASAATAGRSTEPRVGASGVLVALGEGRSVSRETVTVGVGSVGALVGMAGEAAPSVARRETVGDDGVEATTGIATGEIPPVEAASGAVGVPVPPSTAKGTGSTAPRVGACSSAILLTVCPTGNDLGEAGAAICSVTAGGSGAGVMSTADEIRGGPSPPRRRVGAAAAVGASTRGIAGASIERWTMGAPMGVAPEPELPLTEVTVSPEDPRVGDSDVAATGSGSAGGVSGSGVGSGSGVARTVAGVGADGAGAASTTGRLHGSGVSTEPWLALEGAAGLTERSTDIPDGSDQRCTTDVPFGAAAAGGTACTTGRSATSPPRTGIASTTPEGASGVTACPSGDRKPVVCLVVSPAAKSCGGLTSGCVPSTRWTGGMDRQSRRATGGGGTGDGDGGSAARSSLLSRLQGHRMVHRPPFTRVLSPAIWLTYSSLSACSRSRMSSRRQWKW